jgi:hypothetical protein
LRRRKEIINFGYVRVVCLPRGSTGKDQLVVARRYAPDDALGRRMIKPIAFVRRGRTEINTFLNKVPGVAGGILSIRHNRDIGDTTKRV